MKARRTLAGPAALLLALGLVACGETAMPGTDEGGAMSPMATNGMDPGPGDDGAATASVDVTVSGGGVDGSYSGSVTSGGCTRNPLGENTFGLQYSTDEQVELSSLQLVARDADAATSGGSDDFTATITIGDLLDGVDLDINPQSGDGSGTVTIDDRGDTATITIEGETSDGAMVDATVECHTVIDLGG
jgi:hypothetical protein